ncbi:MAG TPA: ABC transporter permease [Edaphocola sp.]|nr:ABC transporter permease [Edaphocola sp.]
MHKSWLIIQREYLTRVRKRSFIIMTLLMPVLFVGMTWLIAYLSIKGSSEKSVAVLDGSHFFEQKLPESDNIHYHYLDTDPETAKLAVNSGKYDAVLIIPPFDAAVKTDLELYSKEQLGLSAQAQITDDLNKVIIRHRLATAGISNSEISDLQAKTIGLHNISEKGGHEGGGMASFAVGYGCGFLLYLFMLIYGMSVMRSVMEEKTNRIAEIIISSVKPYQLMLGKILGVALVGLTQFIIWVVLLLAVGSVVLGTVGINMFQHGAMSPEIMHQASMANNPEMIAGLQSLFNDMNWGAILCWFLFYFLGGYFLYAALYAAVGSLVNDDPQDSQQFTLPITLPIIIAFVLMTTALKDPNSGMAVFGSLFPLTSPIVMMARIPFGVPAWQLILSAALLVIGFILTTGLAAKIYRTGILLYGKKITFKEVAKWLFRNP